MKRALLPIFLLLTASLPGLSQERLTDAFSVRTDQDSNPGRFTALNDLLFFAAATAREGNELWKTDGTPAGTTLVKDIYPGAAGSIGGQPVALGNAVYFFANDGARGVQLWTSDGSTGGTERVTDFLRGRMLGLTPVQDQLFFLLETAEYTWEVWKTNGTAAGTRPVKKNIRGWNNPQNFIAAGNLFYFSLQTEGSNNAEVWRSDGTEAGSFTVISGIDGNGAGETGTSDLTQFIGYKNELYFVARSSQRFEYGLSVGIFKTNGTVAGTIPVKGLHPGNMRLINQANVVLLGGKLYFSFYETDLNRVFIWESDGTPEGTRKVYDASSTAYLAPSTLAHTDAELVFNAPGTNQATDLVKWDPATGNTTTLKEILPIAAGPRTYISSWQVTRIYPGQGNSLLVDAAVAYGPSQPMPTRKLWLSDGTPQGTVQLEDPQPNFRMEAAYFKGSFYTSGIGKDVGTELYKVDGAARLAALLKNINPGRSSYLTYSRLYPFNNKVFFAAGDTLTGTELWQSDGKRETTGLFKEINPGKSGSNAAINTGKELPVLGNRFLFHAFTPEHGTELWSTDGTPEGTAMLKDVVEGRGSSDTWQLTRSGNAAYFTARTPTGEFAIWKTDGTTAGTLKFMELGRNQHGSPFQVKNFTGAGKHLFFSVDGAGSDLWKSDGTEAGTTKLKTFNLLEDFAAVNDQVYFTVINAYQEPYQLWKSDGTEAGTVRVKDALGDRLNKPQLLGEVNGKVIFSVETAVHGRELWVSDGTETGTALLKGIYPGAVGALASAAVPFVKKDNRLYFSADDGATGAELWQTDGTAAGTVLVKDILPGPGSSLPANLALLDGQLYFSAFTPEYGMELWKSNGTDAGTVLAADINPGAGHANPTGMVNLGKDIFFIADTDAHGRQLWHTNPAVTAVQDPSVAAAVAVYPNPTHGEVTLRLDGHFTGLVAVSTLDLTGKVLQSETIRTTAGLPPTVNLRSLPPGLYLLRIAGAQGTVTKKIIKK